MKTKLIIHQDCDKCYELVDPASLTVTPVLHNDTLIAYNVTISESIGTFDTPDEAQGCINSILNNESPVYQVEGYEDYDED